MKRLALCILIATAAFGALAASAQAASIVFIKSGDVWLANPDGSGQYQVTLDGSPGAAYKSPSQANDGTIVALRSGRLFRMRQNGALLNEPIATAAPGSGPLSPAVSPNGSLVAFDYVTAVPRPPSQGGGFVQEVIYTRSNRFTSRTEIDPAGLHFNDPSWIDDGRTMLFFGAQVWTDTIGPSAETKWWDDGDHGDSLEQLRDGETAGSAVVVVRGANRELLALYQRQGGDFATPPTPTCQFSQPTGEFADPTLSPDGSALAWQEGDGIWVSSTPTPASGCAGGQRLAIPGGSQPDFGPANVNPGARPNPLTVSVNRRIKLAALLRRLRVRYTCAQTCGAVASLKVARRTARKLKLPRTIGRGSGASGAGKRSTLTVRVNKKAKRRLRRLRPRRLKVTLQLTAGRPPGRLTTVRRSIAVRR